MATEDESSDFGDQRQRDKLCLRIDQATKDWLILESARRQLETGKIVSINDCIVAILAEDVDFDMSQDWKIRKVKTHEDRPTYTPALPPGLRDRVDKMLRRFQQLHGDKVSYADYFMSLAREKATAGTPDRLPQKG